MRNRLSVCFALLTLSVALPASAATYTVRAGGGGDFTTIQACVNVAQAGDTCEVYAGTYAETVVSVRSGSSHAARVTIAAHEGDRPIVSRFSIGHSYVTISGFEVTNNTGVGISGGGGTVGIIVENNYVHTEYATCIQFAVAPYATDLIIRNNVITRCGWRYLINTNGQGTAWGISFYGARVLIDGNHISHVTDDAINGGGSGVVIRNNHLGPFDAGETGVQSGAHMDGWHNGNVAIDGALLEGNVYQDALDATGNAHFTWIEGSLAHRRFIIRYNYTNNIQDSHVPGLAAPYAYDHFYTYNNTFTNGRMRYQGFCVYFPAGYTYSSGKNNLCYASRYSSSLQPVAAGGTGFTSSGNLVYEPGYSGEWTGLYASESTYNTLKNRDPLFANYPTDGTLQAASPARNAGVPLTTVAANDSGSGTTLILADAGYFQAGFGPSYAPVSADQIRIGTSTYATIASINYATNAVTLTAPVSRTAGAPVYLYKKSDGEQVLFASLPDVGAYPYATPAPPFSLRIIR